MTHTHTCHLLSAILCALLFSNPAMCDDPIYDGQHKLILHYFDVRARGEPTRLLLHYLQIPFEDHRFMAMGQEGWDRFEFGKIPVMEFVDRWKGTSVQLSQSVAIGRYFAEMKGGGLMGATSWERAKVNEYAGYWLDWFDELKDYPSYKAMGVAIKGMTPVCC